MSIKQIGELDSVSSIPIGSKVILENNNDAVVMDAGEFVETLQDVTVSELDTTAKNVIDAINEVYAMALINPWTGTQDEYDALTEYEPNRFYLIVEA